MTQPELEVVWAGGNSFDLLGWNETAYGDVLCEALGEGTEWGNPESIRRTLHRALAAGSALAKDGVENRTVTVHLRLSAADARALAGGEAVLHMLDDQRRVELHWTQPDEYAVPVAFIAVAVDLRRDYSGTWDTDENLVRQTWTLTFTCLPHVRSIEAVEIEALPEYVGAPTVLDDCSIDTNWSLVNHSPEPMAASLAAVAGAIEVTVEGYPTTSTRYAYDFRAILTDALTFTKPYLAIEAEVGSLGQFNARLDGGADLALVGLEGSWRFYDLGGATTATTLELQGYSGSTAASMPSMTVRILTVAESETSALTAGRQSLRIIATPGSAKADGSLVVESRNAAADGSGDELGQVIVYTGPDYDPRMSPYSVGTRLADTTALSGSKETGSVDTGTTFTFIRPAGSIPLGSYSVWARAKGADAQTVSWHFNAGAITPGTVSAYLAGTPTTVVSHTFDGTDYNLFNLGVVDLPGFDVGAAPGLDFAFQVLAYVGADPDVTLDEVLIFNRTTGRLTIIDTRSRDALLEVAGTWTVVSNGGATRLFLDAASLEGNERIVAGSPSREMSLPINLTDELLAYDGAHLFTPGNTFVYVATTETIDPAVTGEFRSAGHSSLAE